MSEKAMLYIKNFFCKVKTEKKVRDFSYQAMLVEYILTQIKNTVSNKIQLYTRYFILYPFKKTLEL